jgi:hypothetical protein
MRLVCPIQRGVIAFDLWLSLLALRTELFRTEFVNFHVASEGNSVISIVRVDSIVDVALVGRCARRRDIDAVVPVERFKIGIVRKRRERAVIVGFQTQPPKRGSVVTSPNKELIPNSGAT